MQHQASGQKGFSLVDVSILVAILGLLMASLLSYNTIKRETNGWQRTNASLDQAKEAIQQFYRLNLRLPCPAPINLRPGVTGYGTEPTGALACGGAGAPTWAANGMVKVIRSAGSRTVRIGALPTRSLGLADPFGLDGWDRKIGYAVIEDLATSPALFDGFVPPAALADEPITILSALPSTRAVSLSTGDAVAYVIFSFGPDGEGAIGSGGATFRACGAATRWDAQNCDLDTIFLDAPINETPGSTYYYDMLRWARYKEIKP
jgi:type II secretory pathway pseudopilin PulG